MTDYLALTRFFDIDSKGVGEAVHLFGEDARVWLVRVEAMMGRSAREGDLILGMRIDRIGSESQQEAL